MQKSYFGTDGIRGKAGVYPLDQAGAEAVGAAVGAFFVGSGDHIIVGGDTRESSSMLIEAVAKGIRSAGIDAVNLGVIPTPGLAYVARNTTATAAIMISASHNPYYDNGIKIFSGEGDKLSDEQEAQITQIFTQKSDVTNSDAGELSSSADLADLYTDFLASEFKADKANISVVIDCANGATSLLAEKVFKPLCKELQIIHNNPDGRNINDHCGATDLASLQKIIVDESHDLGIAFDGDGDRLMLVDANGQIKNGDHILYILGTQKAYSTVVATTMSNLGLEQSLAKENIQLIRVNVGDRYVLEEMAKGGFKLGGEQSGHIIVKPAQTTGDGMLAAIKIMEIMATTGQPLDKLSEDLQIFPQAIVNIELNDRTIIDRPEFIDFVAAKSDEIGPSGRIVIRASGTEPLLRIMIEADSVDELAAQIAKQAAELIDSLVKDHNNG